MKTQMSSARLFSRILWPTRRQKFLTEIEISLLCLVLLVSGSFVYYMTQYIDLYANANQLSRSLLVLADEEETKKAAENLNDKIQAIFPDYLQFFSAYANFQSIDTSSQQEEIYFYCSTEASLPAAIRGRSINFSSSNEILVPSSFYINGLVHDGSEVLGEELEILVPIYQILPDNSGIMQESLDKVAVKVVGVYDSKKNVTQHPNAFFASENFMKQLYERSILNQLSESWYVQGRSPQTVIIANSMAAMEQVQTALERMGYTVQQNFTWNKGIIRFLLAIASIMMALSFIAIILLTMQMWKGIIHSQARELGLLYILGYNKKEVSRLLQKQYLIFFFRLLVGTALVVQVVLSQMGKHLMEGYIQTRVVNLANSALILLYVLFSVRVIGKYLDKWFGEELGFFEKED